MALLLHSRAEQADNDQVRREVFQNIKRELDEHTKLESENDVEEFDDSLDEMIQAVEDHLETEEAELFPLVEGALSRDELNQLGERMEQHARIRLRRAKSSLKNFYFTKSGSILPSAGEP